MWFLLLYVFYLFGRFGKRPGFKATTTESPSAKREKRLPAVSPKVEAAQSSADAAKAALGMNNFSNDGSFMEQFMKISGIKC